MANQTNALSIVPYVPPTRSEQDSGVLSIPNELLANVLEHLSSYRDLTAFSLVSRVIHWVSSQIYSDAVFWRRIFCQAFPQSVNAAITNFEHRFKVHSNLSQSICTAVTHSLEKYYDRFIGACEGKIIKVCIDGGEVQIIDSRQMKIIEKIQCSTTNFSSILHVSFYDEMLVLVSNRWGRRGFEKVLEGIIEIHDKKSGQVHTQTLDSQITAFTYDPGHQMVSGHLDGNLTRFEKSEEGVIATTLDTNLGCPITALVLDHERVIVGDELGRISIFDLTSGALIHQVQAHEALPGPRPLQLLLSRLVSSLAINDNQLFSAGGLDCKIKVWDLKTLELKEPFIEHSILNPSTSEQDIREFLTNESPAYAFPPARVFTQLFFWEGRLITASTDLRNEITEVIIWDVKTKESTILTCMGLSETISIDMDKGLLYSIDVDRHKLQICDFANPEYQ